MPNWDDRYSRGEHSGQQPHPLVERVARGYPPGLALDLACGLGRHTLCLARHGWSVTALDKSPIAIANLRDTALASGLHIHAEVQDLESPDFLIQEQQYRLICDCLYLQRSLIARIRAGVCTGGLAVLVIPMLDDTQGIKPMNPEYLVQSGELRSWFEAWEILEYDENTVPGRRKMAQLIARRPASAC